MIWLIFAHFIGDFPLQGDFLAANKGKLWYCMLSHCIIWTACICLALQYLGLYSEWKVVFLILGHTVCDFWKTRKIGWKYIYPDQAWHIVQCLTVYYL